jgi:hypothetical protein
MKKAVLRRRRIQLKFHPMWNICSFWIIVCRLRDDRSPRKIYTSSKRTDALAASFVEKKSDEKWKEKKKKVGAY